MNLLFNTKRRYKILEKFSEGILRIPSFKHSAFKMTPERTTHNRDIQLNIFTKR